MVRTIAWKYRLSRRRPESRIDIFKFQVGSLGGDYPLVLCYTFSSSLVNLISPCNLISSLYELKRNIASIFFNVSIKPTSTIYWINFNNVLDANSVKSLLDLDLLFAFPRFRGIWFWQLYAYASVQVQLNVALEEIRFRCLATARLPTYNHGS